MKAVRTYIHILLGACITMLVGCGAQKKVKPAAQPEPAQEQMGPDTRVICLYGIPPAVYQELHEEPDSTAVPGDTTTHK